MTHEEASELIAARVLGALAPDERRAVDAHAASCASCRAELDELRAVADALLLAVPPRDPSPKLRDTVLAGAAAARAPRSAPRAASSSALPAWLAAAAALLVAAGSAFYAGQTMRHERRLAAELSRARAENAVLAAPDVVRVDLRGQPVAPGASARVYWSRSRGLVVTAAGLPAPPAAKTYQLWFVTAAGPISAGLLEPGRAAAFENPAGLGAPLALAVTLEPAGGVASPTGDKYLVGAVPGAGA